MDFFDRALLKPVAEGDFIGQLHAPSAGQPGRRLDGVELKVPSVSASKLRCGPTVRLDASGRAYAATAGVVMYAAESKLDIVHQHVHQGAERQGSDERKEARRWSADDDATHQYRS